MTTGCNRVIVKSRQRRKEKKAKNEAKGALLVLLTLERIHQLSTFDLIIYCRKVKCSKVLTKAIAHMNQ